MISNLLDNGFGGGDKGCYCSCFSAISVDLFSDHELLMRENVCIPHPPPPKVMVACNVVTHQSQNINTLELRNVTA